MVRAPETGFFVSNARNEVLEVVFSAIGSATNSDVTDINGDFSIITNLTSGDFTLKPVKTLDKFNGVMAADATSIQQHVTLANSITDPYKQVCADVNKSNSITTIDATLITQALLRGLPLTADNFATYNLSEGELRSVWSQCKGSILGEASQVFQLTFKVLKRGGQLSDALWLDPESSGLPAYAYTSDLQESGVELVFSEATGVDGPVNAEGLQLL